MDQNLKQDISDIKSPETRVNVRGMILAIIFLASVAYYIYYDRQTVSRERFETMLEQVKYLKLEAVKKDDKITKLEAKIDRQDSIIYVQGQEQKITIEKLNYLTETQNDQIKLLSKKK